MSINTSLEFYYKLLKGLDDGDTVNTRMISVLGDLSYSGSLNHMLELSDNDTSINFVQLSDETYLQLSDGNFAVI